MTPASAPPSSGEQKPSHYRWTICGLLLAAIAINYIHRQMIGVLKDPLSAEMGWTEEGYADVVFWFQAAYALGFLAWGRILDKIGARIGYTIAFSIWTLAHMFTGAVTSGLQFTLARVALGIGESGSFPSSLKAVTEWFPQRERALAAGIFNAGSNIGAIIAPLLVPMIALGAVSLNFGFGPLEIPGLNWGWRGAFYTTGALSLIWAVVWWMMYRRPIEHAKVNAAELALIHSDPADHVDRVPWVKLLFVKETWVFAVGKFFIDPIWWLWLFWLPDFFKKSYGLDLKSFGPPVIAVYLLSDVGSVAGGWLSSTLIRRGVSVNIARKVTLLICALCVTPVLLAQGVSNLWVAVLIIGVAAAAHQAFSANLYTLPSDLLPRSAVASVIGIGGMAGAIGGMFMSKFVGYILEKTHNYSIIFMIAAFAYLVAFGLIHLLSPKLTRNTTIGQ
ncbi:MAG: MFS transporter [Asticcacaulis sp.]|uniref:MFS transporter n=1 Tax=Asticcacaulis sp. TaxID=1872648 RepID=UPI0039E6CF87